MLSVVPPECVMPLCLLVVYIALSHYQRVTDTIVLQLITKYCGNEIKSLQSFETSVNLLCHDRSLVLSLLACMASAFLIKLPLSQTVSF